MARRKSRDNLQRAARIQIQRLDRYVRSRPQYKYLSMRILRLKFILNTEAHEKYIRLAYDLLSEETLVADKVGGLHILLLIRDVLVDHGTEVRNNKAAAPSLEHRYQVIKTMAQVHPMCPIKRKLPQQIEFLQVAGADMEALALIMYLEDKLVKDGKILKDDRLPQDHQVYEVNGEVEKCLNDLRMLHLS